MREVHWKFLQYLSGALVFFLVGAHLLLMHLAGNDPRSWGEVSARALNIGWVAFYLAILVFAFYHAIYGLRAIISELSVPPRGLTALNWILSVAGICVFAYAAYVALAEVL